MAVESLLVDIIKSGNVDQLRDYLTINSTSLAQEPITWKDGNGFALNIAAYYDQPEIIEFLVTEKNVNVNRREGVLGFWTALHHAENNNAYRAAAKLLSFDADPALTNSGGASTKDFCRSEAVRNAMDPDYQQREQQKKIEGKWTLSSPVEVEHVYERANPALRLTDIFNFETRIWRAISQNTAGTAMAQNILLFDDVSDKTILHEAQKKLTELGGSAEAEAIEHCLLDKPHTRPGLGK